MIKISHLFLLLILLGWNKAQSQTIDTLIDVGDHYLHFKIVKGNGTPILFESGNGDDGSVWEDILEPIQDSTGATLITYDRAGLGKSEIDTMSINSKQEIKDLKYALKKLGFNKDLFIVSHSFGGFYSTLFSNQNKNRVKGAVYIDVTLPCNTTKEWSRNFVDTISNENWQLIKQYKVGTYYVLKNLEEISACMSDKSLASDIPVTVIAAEEPPIMKQNEADQWTDCLKTFGSLPNHRYVLAKDTGHKVWKDDPKIVIDEVTKLYKRIN